MTSARILVLLLLMAAPVAAQHAHDQEADSPDDHAGHASHEPSPASTGTLPPFIPEPTDADRAAAFPELDGHPPHGNTRHTLVRVDRLEWRPQASGDRGAVTFDGWWGGDLDRLWFSADASAGAGDAEGHVELAYGRAVARWWDVVAGLRQDIGDGPSRTWAAVGLHGLAPFWFEADATLFVGEGGRTRVEASAEYDLLLTNRLILQPEASIGFAGRADPARVLGAGVETITSGLRLRYEIRPDLAPYLSVNWQRWPGETADLRRAAGRPVSERRIAVGIRAWY